MSQVSNPSATTPTLEQQAEIRYLHDLANSHQNLYTLCQALLLMATNPAPTYQTNKDRKRHLAYFTQLIEKERKINPHDRVAGIQQILAS